MSSFDTACRIVDKLTDAGHIAYFAGGWVRDFLLELPSDDIDIATSCSVDDIQRLFPKTIPVGISFGIIIVVEEGHQFEVATFRKDLGYLDGRRPVGIDPADPSQDAQRRDFTINGMFYDPKKKEVIDTVGGIADLKKGVIRAIGNPHERFLEDRLRMIRAVRYASRFQFTIDPDTIQAIIDHAAALLPAVAIERVWQEFKKMDQTGHFDQNLIALHRLGLLSAIFPELKETPIEEISARVEKFPLYPKKTPLIAKILALFSSETYKKQLEICDDLKLSNTDKEFVAFLHRTLDLLEKEKHFSGTIEKQEWVNFYAHPHTILSLEIIALNHPPEKREQWLSAHLHRRHELAVPIDWVKKGFLPLRAHHLLSANVTPGIQMGLLLKEGERLAINLGIDDPSALIELLKQTPHWPV